MGQKAPGHTPYPHPAGRAAAAPKAPVVARPSLLRCPFAMRSSLRGADVAALLDPRARQQAWAAPTRRSRRSRPPWLTPGSDAQGPRRIMGEAPAEGLGRQQERAGASQNPALLRVLVAMRWRE